MNGREFEYAIKNFSKKNCSCNGCNNRHADCHSECDRYKEYAEALEKFKQELKNKRKKEFDLDSYQVLTTMRNAGVKERER